jgi:hypothetical protein
MEIGSIKRYVPVFVIYGSEVEPSPLLLRSFIDLLYQPWMTDDDECGASSGMNEWQGMPKYWEKTCLQ